MRGLDWPPLGQATKAPGRPSGDAAASNRPGAKRETPSFGPSPQRCLCKLPPSVQDAQSKSQA